MTRRIMVITLEPNAPESVIEQIERLAARYPGIRPRCHTFQGPGHTVVAVHLVGHHARGVAQRLRVRRR